MVGYQKIESTDHILFLATITKNRINIQQISPRFNYVINHNSNKSLSTPSNKAKRSKMHGVDSEWKEHKIFWLTETALVENNSPHIWIPYLYNNNGIRCFGSSTSITPQEREEGGLSCSRNLLDIRCKEYKTALLFPTYEKLSSHSFSPCHSLILGCSSFIPTRRAGVDRWTISSFRRSTGRSGVVKGSSSYPSR